MKSYNSYLTKLVPNHKAFDMKKLGYGLIILAIILNLVSFYLLNYVTVAVTWIIGAATLGMALVGAMMTASEEK